MAVKIAILLLCGYMSVTSALPSCVCTRELKPVCGSDGKTYANQCQFNCAQSSNQALTISRQGPCELPSCVCTFIYSPVCGTNGKTYPNECTLNCDANRGIPVELKHMGQCQEQVQIGQINEKPCVCTREKDAQCGSNGVTYSNPCMLRCAKVDLDHAGPCDNLSVKVVEKPENQAVCACTRNLQPVCGSDGKTYSNICMLQCAGKEVARNGPCEN